MVSLQQATIPLVMEGTNREINLKVESDITQDEMSTEYLSKTYKFTYDKKTASNVADRFFRSDYWWARFTRWHD